MRERDRKRRSEERGIIRRFHSTFIHLSPLSLSLPLFNSFSGCATFNGELVIDLPSNPSSSHLITIHATCINSNFSNIIIHPKYQTCRRYAASEVPTNDGFSVLLQTDNSKCHHQNVVPIIAGVIGNSLSLSLSLLFGISSHSTSARSTRFLSLTLRFQFLFRVMSSSVFPSLINSLSLSFSLNLPPLESQG